MYIIYNKRELLFLKAILFVLFESSNNVCGNYLSIYPSIIPFIHPSNVYSL